MDEQEQDPTDEEAGTERLDERLHLRLSRSEKEMIQLLARTAGLSVGGFLVEAARIVGEARVRQIQGKALRDEVAETVGRERRRKRRGPPEREDLMREFRAPFLRRKDAAAFERVVLTASKRMGVSSFSVARLLTFFFEAIAEEVASGEIVRIPGFGIIGPFFSPKAKGIEGCLPRFQASPPFRDYVQMECHARDNRNRELRAHRGRRRKRWCSILAVMSAMRRRIETQDEQCYEAFERWREHGCATEG